MQHVEPTSEVIRTEDYYKKTYENEYSVEEDDEGHTNSYSSDEDNFSDSEDDSDTSGEDIQHSLAVATPGRAQKSQGKALAESQRIAAQCPNTYATRSKVLKHRYL